MRIFLLFVIEYIPLGWFKSAPFFSAAVFSDFKLPSEISKHNLIASVIWNQSIKELLNLFPFSYSFLQDRNVYSVKLWEILINLSLYKFLIKKIGNKKY